MSQANSDSAPASGGALLLEHAPAVVCTMCQRPLNPERGALAGSQIHGGRNPLAYRYSIRRAHKKRRAIKPAKIRRGGDSNPRYGIKPYADLANRCIQPLCHLSRWSRPKRARGGIIISCPSSVNLFFHTFTNCLVFGWNRVYAKRSSRPAGCWRQSKTAKTSTVVFPVTK